jgi:hypothetical protein
VNWRHTSFSAECDRDRTVFPDLASEARRIRI